MNAPLLSALLACLLGSASATCTKPAAPTGADAGPAATYTTKGVVRGIDADKKTMLIAHEDIPGYMKAMTMEFDLRDASLARGIAVGETIQFTFTDEGRGRLVVQKIEKVGR